MNGHSKINAPARRSQAGLTLVEILVTTVIMSVGLLGVAALHLTSLRNGYDSNNRSRATWLANDIADRMRANLTSAQNGDYNVALGGSITGTSTAATDVTQWKQQLANQLQGDGSITTTAVDSDTLVTVNIQWNERGAQTATTLEMQFGI